MQQREGMHKYLCHNGQLLPLSEVRLSPGQAGLLSGWGVFTTMRIYDGQPFAFERHWKRLRADAGRIEVPFDFSAEAVLENLRELIHTNGVVDGCARIYFVYNRFGLWYSDEPFPVTDLLIHTADLPVREGLVRLAVEADARYAADPLTGTKVTSWLQNVWRLERAQRRGFDEVILLNEQRHVTECTAANIFCVRSDRVETPPLSAGCLAGITREVLLEVGSEIGLTIRESSLSLQELREAEEVFITSTTREVQAVSQIEDHTVPRAPGPVTTRLAKAFSNYLSGYFAYQARCRSAASS